MPAHDTHLVSHETGQCVWCDAYTLDELEAPCDNAPESEDVDQGETMIIDNAKLISITFTDKAGVNQHIEEGEL